MCASHGICRIWRAEIYKRREKSHHPYLPNARSGLSIATPAAWIYFFISRQRLRPGHILAQSLYLLEMSGHVSGGKKKSKGKKKGSKGKKKGGKR
jgi:hypothetical protein